MVVRTIRREKNNYENRIVERIITSNQRRQNLSVFTYVNNIAIDIW